MLGLSLKVVAQKAFLRPTRDVTVDAIFRPEAGEDFRIPVSYFLEQLFHYCPNFIPALCFSNEESAKLSDLRGRPADSFSEEDRADAENLKRTQEEEILYTRGVIFDTEAETDDLEGPGNLGEIPFTIRISSKFDSFRGANHISYKVSQSAPPILSEVLPHLSGKLLARLLPLRLDKIRIGLESYTARSFGAMLGLVPTVKDRLYLEISPYEIRLKAASARTTKNTHLPFSESRLLEAIDQSLKQCQLFPNFIESISNSLSSTS